MRRTRVRRWSAPPTQTQVRAATAPSAEARAERVPLSTPHLDPSAWTYVKECLDTGWVSTVGRFVHRFEESLEQYTGATSVVATSCGTSALHLAMLACDIGPGDVVLVPALSFVATVNAVRYVGAEPWFVDVDPDTWNVSADTLAAALRRARRRGRRPKAALVTHLYGVPVDMEPVVDLCAREDMVLVEDAAESLGSTLHGRHTGTFGRAAALSFNGNKIITTGGGGALLSMDPAVASRARHLSTQARVGVRGYQHDEVGYNYRMPNLNAALGVSQLESLPALRARRREIQHHYAEALGRWPGLVAQRAPAGSEVNAWLQAVRVTSSSALDRDGLLEALDAAGIEARPVFDPLHKLPMFRGFGGRCPVAEEISAQGINLPNAPDADEWRVVEALDRLVG